MPEDDVIQRAAAIAAAGYREIVLTGIHLGAWGQDLRQAGDLSSLVRRIDHDVRIDRLRLSSIEPLEVTAELIDCLREPTAALCPHLHIPLQSGDDRILAAMGRQYTADFFSKLVSRLVAEIPSLAVGVDVMAGFPGESEKEFENTLGLLRDLPVAYLHVFPYSDRPKTKASALPDKVEEPEKKRRAAALRSLGFAKRDAFAGRFIGTTQAVLAEESRDRKTGCLKGFTGSYVPVILQDGSKEMINRIVDVRIESVDAGIATGRVCHEQ
jgi:threonylcarbamoyladenosine tRNA methylthiotransferase MtaB